MPASVNNTKETVAVEPPVTDAVTKTEVAADCGATGKTECSTDAGKAQENGVSPAKTATKDAEKTPTDEKSPTDGAGEKDDNSPLPSSSATPAGEESSTSTSKVNKQEGEEEKKPAETPKKAEAATDGVTGDTDTASAEKEQEDKRQVEGETPSENGKNAATEEPAESPSPKKPRKEDDIAKVDGTSPAAAIELGGEASASETATAGDEKASSEKEGIKHVVPASEEAAPTATVGGS